MTSLRLAALFWRRGGARQKTTLAFTAAGVAAAVTLALLVVSVGPALSGRGDRQAWRSGHPVAEDRASMLRRTVTDEYADRDLIRVDLAATGRGRPAAPPGLRAFPRPGELWVSPALARVLANAPPESLGGRFPGPVTGTIGPAGLVHRDELVAVVGRTPAELPPVASSAAPSWSPIGDPSVRPIDRFARHGTTDDLAMYGVLARMAAVLLVVPTLYLLGAAARLTAAQREQRLAVIRLAGGTPTTVMALTAIETALSAAVGTVVGIVGYLALLAPLSGLELAGGPFRPADLRLTPAALGVTLVVVPALAALSAMAGLRQVVVGPLGVRRRTTPKRPSLLRFLVVPAAWVFFASSALSMRDGGESVGSLAGLGAVIATLAVIGPWVTWFLGTATRLLSRRPATTIAARRIVADPKGAYRTISGMVLAGLIAGFLFAVLPTIGAVDGSTDRTTAVVQVPTGQLDAARAAAAAEPGTRLRVDDDADDRAVPGWTYAALSARTPAALDRARTTVQGAVPTASVSSLSADRRAALLLDDLRRASVIMTVAALLMASAAIAVGTAANILDQRDTLARLRLIGVPVSLLQRARRWQILLPLGTASIGALGFGAVSGFTMLLAFGVQTDRLRPPDLAGMGALMAAGIGAGVIVVAVTRPLLEAATRTNPRE